MKDPCLEDSSSEGFRVEVLGLRDPATYLHALCMPVQKIYMYLIDGYMYVCSAPPKL